MAHEELDWRGLGAVMRELDSPEALKGLDVGPRREEGVVDSKEKSLVVQVSGIGDPAVHKAQDRGCDQLVRRDILVIGMLGQVRSEIVSEGAKSLGSASPEIRACDSDCLHSTSVHCGANYESKGSVYCQVKSQSVSVRSARAPARCKSWSVP